LPLKAARRPGEPRSQYTAHIATDTAVGRVRHAAGRRARYSGEVQSSLFVKLQRLWTAMSHFSGGHRRAPVGGGRPSACHGCAVACIGQPPPPSAPGPVLGWQAGLSSRGCGGAALTRIDWAEVKPSFPRAAARPAGHSVPNLACLLISFPIHQRIALLCVDPLPRSRSAHGSVRLYW
jgi:hypothetical protein